MLPSALICSHPRSGGRWLRVLLAHYLEARYRLGWEVTPQSVFAVVPDHNQDPTRGYPTFRFRGRRRFPIVAVCHQPYTSQLHRALPTVFLARNAYDVVVSAFFHLSQEKGHFDGSLREFIQDPRQGLPSWIEYMNSWAPNLLRHRDVGFIAYGELDHDPGEALRRVLEFIDESPDEQLITDAVVSAQTFRTGRQIRTGQEGNFWDHLQPDDIFEIQERTQTGLSEFSSTLLSSIGVDLDPFPRTSI